MCIRDSASTARQNAAGAAPALDKAKISSYKWSMRRKPGALLPLEVSILTAGIDAMRAEEPEFHGFSIAKAIQERDAARRLTAHGTLYKALGRLERGGAGAGDPVE